MVPSLEAKKDMLKMLSALDNIGEKPKSSGMLTEKIPDIMDDLALKEAAKKDMSKILCRLNNAFYDTVEGVKEEAETYPELKRALNTQKVDNGVKISEWNITENNKRFSITHNGEVIVEEFRNYKSATIVVKLLEKGIRVNNSQIMEIFDLENRYATLFNEALLYKKYLGKSLNEAKRSIYEDKFEETKIRLHHIKDKLNQIDSSLP